MDEQSRRVRQANALIRKCLAGPDAKKEREKFVLHAQKANKPFLGAVLLGQRITREDRMTTVTI